MNDRESSETQPSALLAEGLTAPTISMARPMFGALALGQFAAFLLPVVIILVIWGKVDTVTAPITLASFLGLWPPLIAAAVFAAKRRGESVFGDRPIFRVKDLQWLVLGVVCQFGIGIVTVLVFKLVGLDADEFSKPARELFDRAEESRPLLLAIAIAAGVCAPIVEELFYRGGVWRGLEIAFRSHSKWVRDWAPVVTSALIFGAIHFQPLQFIPLAVVGAVCAWVMRRTQRVMPAIAVHAGFNLTSVVVLVGQILARS